MQLTKIEKNGIACAVVNSNEIVITDAQSALDVLMSAKYDIGTKNIVVDKKLITEDFFILSKGLAGEILQKYVNYQYYYYNLKIIHTHFQYLVQ